MTKDELGARVRAAITHQIVRFRGDAVVTDESKLLDGGLKLDSLDLVEITMALEDELDMEIADDEVDALSTVGELITYLAGKLDLAEVAA